jgi:hypothetical protein
MRSPADPRLSEVARAIVDRNGCAGVFLRPCAADLSTRKWVVIANWGEGARFMRAEIKPTLNALNRSRHKVNCLTQASAIASGLLP